jgi:hypothetical protein
VCANDAAGLLRENADDAGTRNELMLLKQNAGAAMFIKCPICRKQTFVPRGISALPYNYAVISVLGSFDRSPLPQLPPLPRPASPTNADEEQAAGAAAAAAAAAVAAATAMAAAAAAVDAMTVALVEAAWAAEVLAGRQAAAACTVLRAVRRAGAMARKRSAASERALLMREARALRAHRVMAAAQRSAAARLVAMRREERRPLVKVAAKHQKESKQSRKKKEKEVQRRKKQQVRQRRSEMQQQEQLRGCGRLMRCLAALAFVCALFVAALAFDAARFQRTTATANAERFRREVTTLGVALMATAYSGLNALTTGRPHYEQTCTSRAMFEAAAAEVTIRHEIEEAAAKTAAAAVRFQRAMTTAKTAKAERFRRELEALLATAHSGLKKLLAFVKFAYCCIAHGPKITYPE